MVNQVQEPQAAATASKNKEYQRTARESVLLNDEGEEIYLYKHTKDNFEKLIQQDPYKLWDILENALEDKEDYQEKASIFEEENKQLMDQLVALETKVTSLEA